MPAKIFDGLNEVKQLCIILNKRSNTFKKQKKSIKSFLSNIKININIKTHLLVIF